MITVRVKKGYDLHINGVPSASVETRGIPERVAVLPEHIPFVKPRLKVAEGDTVSVGTPLFEDKQNTRLVFLSPGGGRVESINYGKRRVVKEIVIKLDPEEHQLNFPVCDRESLPGKTREEIVDLLVNGGLWPLVRVLPFRSIADPTFTPKNLIVTLGSKDRFQPSPDVYLAGNDYLFEFGIDLLKRLADTVWITTTDDVSGLPEKVSTMVTHRIRGSYPSHDPGVVLYRLRKSSDENRTWFVDGQDVLLMASLFRKGVYPTEKVYAIGGEASGVKTHVKARIGAPVAWLSPPHGGRVRYVSGGVLTGYRVPESSYMGFYESSLTVLPEGDEEEFFGFIRPGFSKPSFSRTFLSVFNRGTIPVTCNMHGELRACINCGTCEKVCPVDILPQFTLKCIVADEVEEALAHGLLDCVGCGLCAYVCPSKIELNRVFSTAKADYSKERA